MLLFLLTFVLLTLLLTFYLYRKFFCHRYFKRLGIAGPAPHWFYGNMRELWCERRHEVVAQWSRTYGKVYGYYEGPTPILVVSSIDAVEQVCVKQFSNFQGHRINPIQPNATLEPEHPLSHMLFAQGETWKRLRVIVNPAFSSGKLRNYTRSMTKPQMDLMELFGEQAAQKTPFDIRHAFQLLTLDIISEVGFGIEFNAIRTRCKGSIVAEKLKWFLDFASQRAKPIEFMMLLPECVPLLKPLVIRQMKLLFGSFGPIGMLLDLVGQLIAVRRANPNTRRVDLLQLMLDANGANASPNSSPTNSPDVDLLAPPSILYKSLSETEIKAQAFLFFFAGYETTSTTLAFISHLLAKHQDIQEKVYQEIEQALAANKEADYEMVTNQLPYLDCVCRETIRLFPIGVNFINRFVVNDTHLGGIPVPKSVGCVQIDVWSIHQDAALWGPVDPAVFYPERFSPENSANRPDVAFLGFGYGPRLCIGARLAMVELKLTMVNLLHRFRLVEPGQLKISSREGLLTSLDKVQVKLVERHSTTLMSPTMSLGSCQPPPPYNQLVSPS